MVITEDYMGMLLFVYENGKVSKVPLSAYATKTNRKKLTGACSDKSPLVKIFHLTEESVPVLLRSSGNRAILIDAAQIPEKASRSTQGVNAMTIKKGQSVVSACIPSGDLLTAAESYRVKTLPAAGKLAKDLEDTDQLTLV